MTDRTQKRTNITQPVRLLLRGLGIFLLLSLLCVLLYWFCLHHYSNVAEWSGTTSPREAILYQEQTYHLAAELGAPGVPKTRFKQSDLLGEVKPGGRDSLQAAVKVYAIEHTDQASQAEYLLLIYEDKTCYVYYLDGVDNPYTGAEAESDSQTP